MSDFETAAAIVLNLEGGYQAHPDDSGNYNDLGRLVGTNRGISAPFFAEYFNFQPSVQDMKDLTEIEAKTIYKALRWDAFKLGSINDQSTANHVFDLFVNHSPAGASKIVQDTLTDLGYTNFGGLGFGNMTRAEINAATGQSSNVFNSALVDNRILYYYNLVDKNQKLIVFLNGWLERAKKFHPVVLAASGLGSLALISAVGYLFYSYSE